MKKTSRQFLQKLLDTPSPSGYEQTAAKLWRQYVGQKVDNVTSDVHGNSIAVINPDADFKIMLAGHIDEIGLMVTHVDDNGFIFTSQIGGMDPSLLIGQRVKIMTEKGDVFGVIGRKAIHLIKPEERKKAVNMENIWVDIGAKDKKDALKKVSIGDAMIIDVQFRELANNMIVARATDDRVGAFAVAEVARELAKRKPKIGIIAVATVQEEIGLRGAITSTYNVNPDAGICVEVTFASDHPDTDPKKTGEVKLGSGPVIARGPNMNPPLTEAIFKKAKSLKMDYQVIGFGRATGTDANAMQLSRGGVATALVKIPNRYMHTPVEVVSVSDLDDIVKLLVEFLASHPASKDYRP